MDLKCENHPGNNAIAVCHHCGRPLCNLVDLPYNSVRPNTNPRDRLCGYSIRDLVFSSKAGQGEVRANHCESCLQLYHNEFGSQLGRLKANL